MLGTLVLMFCIRKYFGKLVAFSHFQFLRNYVIVLVFSSAIIENFERAKAKHNPNLVGDAEESNLTYDELYAQYLERRNCASSKNEFPQ